MGRKGREVEEEMEGSGGGGKDGGGGGGRGETGRYMEEGNEILAQRREGRGEGE